MSAKSPKAEAMPTHTRILAVVVFVCVIGGVGFLLTGVQPNTTAFQLGWAAIWAGAILAVFVAVLEYRRTPHAFARPSSSLFENLTALPLPSIGVSWVSIDAAYAKRARRIFWASCAIPVAVALLPWLLQSHDSAAAKHMSGTRSIDRLIEMMYGFFFVTIAVAAIITKTQIDRRLRSRLGADSTHVLYDPGTGEIERHPWSSVLTDKSVLLIGSRLVTLAQRSGFRSMAPFPADALRGLILARIPRACFVTPLRLQWNALMRGNGQLWIVVAGTTLYATTYLVSRIHPEWLRAARAALAAWILARIS